MSGQFIYKPLLSNFGVQLGTGNFAGSIGLAPLKRSNTITGAYSKFARASNGKVQTARAAGAPYNRKEPARGELVNFQTLDNGIIVPVPLEEVAGYGVGDLFKRQLKASREAQSEVFLAHARDTSTKLWGANQAAFNAIYGAAAVNVPDTKFDASGSAVELDIAEANTRLYNRSGVRANRAAMNQDTFDAITMNPNSSVAERMKYTSKELTSKESLARAFNVDEIVILDELVNSANAGQAQAYGQLYSGDNVILYHADTEDSAALETVTLAATMYWLNGNTPFLGVMERWNEETQCWEYRANGYYDVQRVQVEAAQVLFDVLT